jgi:hypothetical protein
VAGTSSGSIIRSTVSVSFKTVLHRYNEDYLLSSAFFSCGEEQPCRKCVVCGKKLANQAMVPSKLKRHLHTKHIYARNQLNILKGLQLIKHSRLKQWTKITTISDKVQEAIYAIAEIMA